MDKEGNSTYSFQKIENIDVSTEGIEIPILHKIKKKSISQKYKSIRPDDSLVIFWQVEYFYDILSRCAIQCPEEDIQPKVGLVCLNINSNINLAQQRIPCQIFGNV